jgi:hypothetical protein
MLNNEPGCTTAKPPETAHHSVSTDSSDISSMCDGSVQVFLMHTARRTEKLLAASALLNDFDDAGLQLLDGWNVLSEDTHLSSLGGNVHLDAGMG